MNAKDLEYNLDNIKIEVVESLAEPNGYITDKYGVANTNITLGSEYTAYTTRPDLTSTLVFTPADGSAPITTTLTKENTTFTPSALGSYVVKCDGVEYGGARVSAPITDESCVLASKGNLKVAYLGGSITQGTGASPATNRWSTKLTSYFNSLNIGTTFTEINGGIGGTGAEYGVLRTTRDIIQYDPDIVFVEFAINDQNVENTLAQRSYEGIIRKLMGVEKVPYIVCVGVVSNKDARTKSSLHKKIATKYGLDYIDLQDYMDADYGTASPGSNTARDALFVSDNIHPSNAGYDVYTKYLKDTINAGTFKKPVDNGAYSTSGYITSSGTFINASELNINGNWSTYGSGDWDDANLGTPGSGLASSNASDELTYTFHGTIAVIGHRIGAEQGKMVVTLDGVETVVDCFYATTHNQHVTWYAKTNLADTEHTISIRPAGDKNASATSNEVKIDFLIIGEDNYLDVKSVVKDITIGDNKLDVKVKSAVGTNAMLILATYDADKLTQASITPISIGDGIPQVVSVDFNTTNISNLKALVIDNNMKPYGLPYVD